jgi:hypothetical protein
MPRAAAYERSFAFAACFGSREESVFRKLTRAA